MMAGYWNRPDLDRASFYPYQRVPGFCERYYRTGDIVEVEEDGGLTYVGRKDRQAKIRGYRVELDEIEATLTRHPHIVEAAVVALPGVDGTLHVHAAAISRDQEPVVGNDILGFAASHLPPYAVPETLHLQPSLPRTTSGKIDRKAVAQNLAAHLEGRKPEP